jgi:hypothetical protein
MMKVLLAIAIISFALLGMLTPGVAWAGSNGLFDGVGSAGGTTYIRPDGSGGYTVTQPSYPSASPSIINRDGYQTQPFNGRMIKSICPTCNDRY